MKRGYQCDNCKSFTTHIGDIFNCLGCEKEICEYCFDRFAHCKECSKKKTYSEMEKQFNERYYA